MPPMAFLAEPCASSASPEASGLSLGLRHVTQRAVARTAPRRSCSRPHITYAQTTSRVQPSRLRRSRLPVFLPGADADQRRVARGRGPEGVAHAARAVLHHAEAAAEE